MLLQFIPVWSALKDHIENRHLSTLKVCACYMAGCNYTAICSFRLYRHLVDDHRWTSSMVAAAKEVPLPLLIKSERPNNSYVLLQFIPAVR